MMSKAKHTFEIDYTGPGWGEAMEKYDLKTNISGLDRARLGINYE